MHIINIILLVFEYDSAYFFSSDFKFLLDIYFCIYSLNYMLLKVFKDIKLNLFYKFNFLYMTFFYTQITNTFFLKYSEILAFTRNSFYLYLKS